MIAFEVDADQVAILGVFYGGQDYETSFQEEKDEEGCFVFYFVGVPKHSKFEPVLRHDPQGRGLDRRDR